MSNPSKIEIDPKVLQKLYWQEEKSTTEIAILFGCSPPTIMARMKENNIPLRTPSQRKKAHLNPSFGRKGKFSPRWGKKHSKLTKEKIKKNVPRGKAHVRWKHPTMRKEPVNNQIRNCYKMKSWKLSVFRRDGFLCLECKKPSPGKLNADHIIPFSTILEKNNIKSLKEALVCVELWDISNGRTLCESCHKDTPTYGYKLVRGKK